MSTIVGIIEHENANDSLEAREPLDNLIATWLEERVTQNSIVGYTHRLLTEQVAIREQIKEQLKERVKKAHEDARRNLRKVVEDTLDPLGETSVDPAQGYPELLPPITLKGYLGEVFAAIVAEEFSHFGHNAWCVPAYPFRFHQTAFDYLEALRQGSPVPGAVVGRAGDDMLAFTIESNGKISRSLVCEAKCTGDHDASMIADAHRKASAQLARPIEIRRLAEILRDYDDAESVTWRNALSQLYVLDDLTGYERFDLVCYVCARHPQRSRTWMSSDRPHSSYTGGRKLESVEIHLDHVDELVRELYGS